MPRLFGFELSKAWARSSAPRFATATGVGMAALGVAAALWPASRAYSGSIPDKFAGPPAVRNCQTAMNRTNAATDASQGCTMRRIVILPPSLRLADRFQILVRF